MATVITRIGPADRGRMMTLQEYRDAESVEGYRYELARGVLEVTKVPREAPHGSIVWFFLRTLAAYDTAHPGVIARAGGAGEYQLLLPGMISGRNPDIAVTLAGTPKDVEGERPPALAIEVVSRGRRARRRDYETKRQEYLAYGLREYWIVDPIDRRVTVLVRDGDAWVERVFAGEQSAEGPVLPGFALRLPELWAAAEQG